MHQLLDYARELGLHVIEKKGRQNRRVILVFDDSAS